MKNNSKLLQASFPTLNQLLIDCLPVNIFIIDKNGYVVWGNQRMVKILGETQDSIIGQHISHWGKDRWESCEKFLKYGSEQIIEEIGADQRVYLTSKTLVKMEDDLLVQGIIGISLDITEQKQAERAKSAFVMNMAHDIRTPFSGIIGLAQCQAMYGLETPEEVKDHGKMIYQSGNQLLEILDSVVVALDKNNIDDIKKDKIDLYKFSQEVQELIEPNVFLNGLGFELKVDEEIGEIVTDKIRLKQILANLLSNAVKFTSKGKITLSFEWTYLNHKRDKLNVRVSDTGIGIDKSNHERIFEKFEKIKPSYESSTYTGCGMGLYLVKQLLGHLEGVVSLESELGKGSTFQIEIPSL